jgi:ketosteroid isomerase-like protein
MSEENVEIVRQLHEAFARRDNKSPFAVYDPDIEYDLSRAPGLVLPGKEAIYHGHDGVRRYWRSWLQAWGSVDAPVEQMLDAGDEVVVLMGRATLRGKISGAEVEIPPWAQVWNLREGKVIRLRLYPDHAEGLKAAGLRE